MIMSRNAPTFEFADDSPVKPGRKHRRGRGYMPNRKGNASAKSRSSGTASQDSSYGQGAGQYSSAASAYSAKSLSAQIGSPSNGRHKSHQQPQANHYTADDWDTPNANNRGNSSNNDADQNSCAGSLTYSASSSVQSAESSNDSSFADIIKLIDSEGEGASEIKEFMAKQSKAASGDNAREGSGSSHGSSAAVQGWMQRKQMQQARLQQQMQMQMQQKKKQQYSMAPAKNVPSGNVDLNYSKDDSSEDDVFGVEFDETELETIAGLNRGEDAEAKPQADPFLGNQNPFRNSEPHETSSPYGSAPSSPRSGRSGGNITPPPNTRNLKRTSTPPGASSISRTNSRHSKSSSDGSWDTPAPASPPGGAGSTTHPTKPPHHMSRSTPVGKSRRKNGKDERAIEDLSEAFYAKSWMCGFADAFNFDGFDKFQK